ncbi:MAG: tryptophan synthase subunit alpha [Trueperella sp.]|nr:tryptophan synthase subunit alpha [Trueperella sp.]
MKTATVIDNANAAGHAAFIGYLTAGFPTVADSITAAKTLVDAGVDIIELGFPYSDPTMDGAIIQRAAQGALERGIHRADIFHIVEEVAKTGISILVMTYYNPVFHYGVENFARDLQNAGGAGLITPDLIPEEAADWIAAADARDLDHVFLVAPSSSDARLAITANASRGFVYAASRMGTTGLRDSIDTHSADLVARTRAAGAERVCVGIGVSNAAQAREVGQYADGVIVGTAIVKPLVENTDPKVGIAKMREIAVDIANGAHAAR